MSFDEDFSKDTDDNRVSYTACCDLSCEHHDLVGEHWHKITYVEDVNHFWQDMEVESVVSEGDDEVYEWLKSHFQTAVDLGEAE